MMGRMDGTHMAQSNKSNKTSKAGKTGTTGKSSHETQDGRTRTEGNGRKATKATDGHRHSSRRPSRTTMTATVFAISTLATMAVVFALVMLVSPVSFGIRMLPDLRVPGILWSTDTPVTDSVGLVASGILLYAMARLTRNATLEADMVNSTFLRRAWILVFELLWVMTFVMSSELLATCVDGLIDSPIGGMVSWDMAVLVVSARCLLARRDHHFQHVACEALRAIGRSAIVCLAWSTVSLLALQYGILAVPAMLGIVAVVLVAVVVWVVRPCLTEGRHRCDQEHDAHVHEAHRHHGSHRH